MHGPERSNHPFVSITDSSKNIVNMNQEYNKSLLDYLKRLKQAQDVLEARAGKDILGNYVENLKKINNATETEEKKKIRSEYFNKWMTYLLISNSNQSKYSGLEN